MSNQPIKATSKDFTPEPFYLIQKHQDDDYSEILKNLKVEYRSNEKLIYKFHHWHYCMANGREKLADMIKELKLEKE